IVAAVEIAAERGLRIPLVYNCGGYESLETLRLLDGIFDIYMPDIKYDDPKVAWRLSRARNYPEVAREAVREMHRQVGNLVLDEDGVAVRGLIVRHLVLPGGMAGTEGIMRFLAEEISRDTYVNIMEQYHPCYRAFDHPPLDRSITRREFTEALQAARRFGLHRFAD
ncbi:MAG: radical SAM protein, partial [Syntrophothermus sp.]